MRFRSEAGHRARDAERSSCSATIAIGDFRERCAAPANGSGKDEHVLHGPRQADADDQPQEPGHVPVLNRQHRTDQRSGPGNRGEVVAEEHPFIGRIVVVPVAKAMGRRQP